MKPIVNVALYTRVSTRDKGQDNENQLAQLREFCRRHNWHIVPEYVDRATGKNGDREQFRAMFAAASRREFDAIVTWALDRLSREGVAQTFEHINSSTSRCYWDTVCSTSATRRLTSARPDRPAS
jgi:DNA invertase Pin-like site-specific DNA recombinase